MNIKEIILLEEVALDIKIAKEFYENQNQGLGNYFKDTIISDIESLWLYPGIHIKVFDTHRLLSKRFPYSIYYKIDSNIVIAVLDLRQNPKSISKFISNRKK